MDCPIPMKTSLLLQVKLTSFSSEFLSPSLCALVTALDCYLFMIPLLFFFFLFEETDGTLWSISTRERFKTH